MALGGAISGERSAAATRWRGERMDYELGVWVLCQQTERARRNDVSAETSAA